MLSMDPTIAWLDLRHLRNWWTLALPPGVTKTSDYAILVLDRGILIHAVRSGEGVLELGQVRFEGTGRAALRTLAKSMDVSGLLVLEHEALAGLFESAEQNLKLGDTLAVQGIGIWQALRRAEGIWSVPALFDLIPPLRADALQHTFDFLVPDESCLVAYVMDGREVFCSLIAEKQKGAICLATMHPAIGDLLSEQEICRDWRSHYDRVNRAVSGRFQKPCISIFAERGAVERILRGPAEQLAAELRARNVIVDPAPLWLQGLLGGAAALAAATMGAKSVARFLPKSARRMASDFAGAAQARVRESGVGPFARLGFDPIELLESLRSFYVPSPGSATKR